MLNDERKIEWITGTPIGISIYSVDEIPTQMNEDILEIIFCLKGSVKFSYAYEEFTLHEGEYISVDKDAYYLYNGRENICASVYIDLRKYIDKYPFILTALFICEGLRETSTIYPTEQHERLKGLLISLLKFYSENNCKEEKNIKILNRVSDGILELFINHFSIIFFFTAGVELNPDFIWRYQIMHQYMYENMKRHITVKDMAEKFNFNEGYTSAFLRKVSLGFRGMLAYMRANESEKYLLATNKTIIQISEECGFSDVKYYYQAFKKWYKCTPNQFREKYGNDGIKVRNIKYIDTSYVRIYLNKILIKHYTDIFFHKRI